MRNALSRAIQRFRDLPLQAKGLAVVAIPLAGLMLVLLSFYMVQKENQAAEQTMVHAFQVRAQIGAVHTRVQECESGVMGYLLTGDASWLVAYREDRRELPEALNALEQMVRDNPAELAHARKLKEIILKRRDQLEAFLAQVPPLSGWNPALVESSAAIEQIDHELHLMRQQEDMLLEQHRARSRKATRSGYYAIGVGVLLVPAAAIAAMFLFAAAITRRIQVLKENAQRLAEGTPIAPMRSGRDEIGQLERSLGAAASLLAERQKALRDATNELEARVESRTAELAGEVAERIHTEEALADTNARLQAVIDASPLAIMRIDMEGRVRSWNRAAEEMSGFSAGEVIGKPLSSPDGTPGLSAERLAAIARGERLNGLEITRRRKDGSLMDLRVWTAPVRNAAGEIRGEIAIAADFSEQRRLQEQFMQAQKMEAIGRLAGGAAHDFNNVITVISGYGQILLDAVADVPPLKEAAEEVLRAGDRAAALASQLLVFSRRQVIQPKVLNVNTVVSGLQRMLTRLLGEDIDLKTDLSPDLGSARADPGQIEQVIVNLAVNARDAMPEGGRLTIETANVELDEAYTRTHAVPPGHYIMMAVSDTGTGMTSEIRTHIFEPFFTTKERGKGTGLGLSTVYGIIKQHGGEIFVYSEPGQGATFKIFLPRVVEAAVPSAAAEAPAAPLPRGNETVLVVEDEEGVRKLVGSVLELSGYRVLEADSGEAAMEVSSTHEGEIQLLVTDVVMPKMSGRDLAQALVLLRPNIKVLFLSGYADRAVIEHGILDTGAAFMQKPFTPDALARKVREVLDKLR